MQAVGYLRTSSAANVGGDKDSETRQRAAIDAYAERTGTSVAQWFYDAAVSGADAIEARAGFSALLRWCAEHGVKTIICENASRFARDAMIAELGFRMLKKSGFTLIASDDPDAFTNATPTGDLVRGILAHVSQFEKANLVAKLRGARDRKRAALGRCEGVRGYDHTRPELVAEAHALAPGRSLRAVAAELAQRGYRTEHGNAFSAAQVSRLLAYSVTAPGLLDGVRSDADAIA